MPTTYFPYGVNLSHGQLQKLKKAYDDNAAITIRLGKSDLSGPHEMMLTKTQINRISKARKNGTGTEIKTSKTQIRKAIIRGGSLWSSLLSLGAKALPFVTKRVSKVAPHLATGALSALGSLGIDKIFGSGPPTGGAVLPEAIVKMLQKGIEVPVKFLVNLINMKEMLTNAQKTLIGKGIQGGCSITLKPTRKQINGGFLGTLAAIGIPMAIELASKLFGKGLMPPGRGQGLMPPRREGQGLQVMPKPYLGRPPPFYGSWNQPTIGMGGKKKKKKSGKGLILGKNSPFEGIPLLGAIL